MNRVALAQTSVGMDKPHITTVINKEIRAQHEEGYALVDLKPLTDLKVFLVFAPSDHRIP